MVNQILSELRRVFPTVVLALVLAHSFSLMLPHKQGSFIDVLHVASRFSARTFVIYDAGDRKFVSKSLLKAILHSFSSADVPSSTDNKVLEVDFKAIKYPALVLPEGTTSNGRGLLTFESGAFRGVDRGKKITLVGFNYGNPRVVTFSAVCDSPNHPKSYA
mmetsp:Transcript_43502/g.170163  ORF Transcript_43502/g.170163 Transcript_43502/m.170163 type:complete len:161 (-) Transcript_43502:2529-3011(-)